MQVNNVTTAPDSDSDDFPKACAHILEYEASIFIPSGSQSSAPYLNVCIAIYEHDNTEQVIYIYIYI